MPGFEKNSKATWGYFRSRPAFSGILYGTMKTTAYLAVAIPLAVHHVSAVADGAESATNDLGRVSVTASPVTQEERVEKDGAEIVTLSRGQLGELNAQDLQTALRQVPGVTISRYSPIGSYGGAQGGSVYIRGQGAARPGGEIRMYTDGVPRESGVWGHPLMDSVPVDFADSVQIAKNPSPGRYAGTFGAVDVETRRRREDGYEGELGLAYGRFNTLLSSVSAGMKDGAFDAYAGLSYKRSDGVRKHNDAEMATAFGRIGAELSEYERLSFVYQRTDSSVEDPGARHTPTPHYDRFDLATDLYTLRFDTDRDFIKGYSLVYFEHGAIEWRKDHLSDGVLTSPAGTADTTWLNWGTRSRYEISPIEEFTLVAALDAASEGGHTANVRFSDNRKVFGYAARFVTVSPYAGAYGDISLGEDFTLTPSAGARAYLHSVYDTEWGPEAAVKLAWRETLELFANASRGVHYPGIYTRAMADDFARHTLDAETMDYFAVGAKAMAGDDFDAILTFFHTEIADRIERTATTYINSGDMRASGIEASAHYRPVSDVSLFLGGAWASAETHPATRLPEWTMSAGCTWKVCDYLKWTVDGQYIGSMYAYSPRAAAERDAPGKVDDAFVFNTRLAVPLESFTPVSGEIYVSIENFTNQHYEYYPGYPMGGTMAYIGFRVKF